jgi:hypothetical protein
LFYTTSTALHDAAGTGNGLVSHDIIRTLSTIRFIIISTSHNPLILILTLTTVIAKLSFILTAVFASVRVIAVIINKLALLSLVPMLSTQTPSNTFRIMLMIAEIAENALVNIRNCAILQRNSGVLASVTVTQEVFSRRYSRHSSDMLNAVLFWVFWIETMAGLMHLLLQQTAF